jgi:hypothetical protein
MNYKEDLLGGNKGTEGGNITMDSGIRQENTDMNKQSKTEIENKQTVTLSLNIPGNRSSARQKKAPKSLSDDFYGNRKLTC